MAHINLLRKVGTTLSVVRKFLGLLNFNDVDVLESIIRSLSSDEVRRFKILSNRFKTGEKKLVILFDAIRGSKFGQEDDLVKELYGNTVAQTRNRYYRLRNKLLENICKSLVFYHYKSVDSIQSLYDYQTAILMRDRNEFELSYYFLKRADKKASECNQYALLELIFDEYSILSLEGVDIPISEMLTRRAEYQEKLNAQRKMDMILAEFKQELSHSRLSKVNGNILSHVEEIKNGLRQDSSLLDLPEGQIRLNRAVLNVLKEKGSSPQIAEFLSHKLEPISRLGIEDEDFQREFLLQRLAQADAFMHSRQRKEASEVLALLEKEIEIFPGKDRRSFLFQFTLRKMDNLDQRGMDNEFQELAMESLSMLPAKAGIHERYSIHYRLARHWFSIGQPQKAIDAVTRIRRSSDYELLSEGERFYLEFLDLTSTFLTENYFAALEQLKAFKKEFRKQMKIRANRRVTEFVVILQRLIEAPMEGKKVSINSAVRKFEARCNAISTHYMELFDPYLLLVAIRDEKTYSGLANNEQEKPGEALEAIPTEEFGSINFR